MRVGRSLLVTLACLWAAYAAAQDRPAGDDDPAAVRIVRVGSAAAPLNVWLGDVLAFERVEPGAWGPYTVVAAGPSPVSFAFASDGNADADGPSAAPSVRPPPNGPVGEVDLEPASYHTLVVIARDGEEPTFVTLHDDLGSLPPAGLASVRVVHARPGGEPLALLVRALEPDGGGSRAPPPPEPLDGGATGLLGEVESMAAGDRVPLPAGRYLVWWVAPDGNAVAADALEIHLRPATVHTLVAIPDEEGAPAPPLLIVEAGAPRPGGAVSP